MNRDSAIDYLSCILFKAFAFLIRFIPKGICLFLGRRLGDLFYFLDLKHRAVAYANLKTAFAGKKSSPQLRAIIRKFYQHFGMSFFEVFFLPSIDYNYVKKYISFEGREHIDEAFKKGKGVIFGAMHAGSWELSNIICPSLGFPFTFLARDQKHPRLNALLNSYRKEKGCKLVERHNQIRGLVDALKNNEAVGMTVDQGGRSGSMVKFFGKDASMATGAVKLSLKYGSVILPAFYARTKGPYIKTIIKAPFRMEQSGSLNEDINTNLQRLVNVLQEVIEEYPADYYWPYKIWKYSGARKILILSDAKTGHLRQSQQVASIAERLLAIKDKKVEIQTLEPSFKNEFSKTGLTLCAKLSDRYSCQGCLWCLRRCLTKDSYQQLTSKKFDIIISAGSSLAALNFILSHENLARSIVIMKPSILSTRRFDLVIEPEHDRPKRGKNIVVTSGALNLINEGYLQEQSQELLNRLGIKRPELAIGLLIGGNTKQFCLSDEQILTLIRQIKETAEKLNAEIFITTSRRTPKSAEALLKKEFADYARLRLLVIANENNIPEAVGGILGLCSIIVTSAESISMISEAAASKNYTFVFGQEGLDRKHEDFLAGFAKNKFIYLAKTDNLAKTIQDIWLKKPQINSPDDNSRVSSALKNIL